MQAIRTEPCDQMCTTGFHKFLKKYYLLVGTTCTHHVGHRCPTCFGNLLLRCFDVLGSQIGSTESGHPVWTYENRSRPIGTPPHGSFKAGSGPGVHVRPYMYRNQRPGEIAIGWRPCGPPPVLISPDRIP